MLNANDEKVPELGNALLLKKSFPGNDRSLTEEGGITLITINQRIKARSLLNGLANYSPNFNFNATAFIQFHARPSANHNKNEM